jgi:hypothetical protein
MLRRLSLRLALIAGGFAAVLAVLLLLEGALALAGLGASRRNDPFVGFAGLVPMFERELDADGRAVMRTARARATRHRDQFALAKPANGFRAFVIGGSSAAGVPYGYPYAFAHWLEQKLAAELPGRTVEVVNAAVAGYASRRERAVVEELAGYSPDLLVVYTGHNELLERRFYAHLLELDPRLFRAWRWLAGFRLYAVLSDRFGIDRRTRPEDVPFDDLDALREMFSAYRARLSGRDARIAQRDREYAELHFAANVDAMIDAMQAVGARVALVSLAQNLADWPPGGSRQAEALGEAELAAFAAALAAGDRAEASSCREAVRAWSDALALDDEVAELHFRLAGCARREGDFARARRHYQLASDLDTIPHGAPSGLNDILRERAAARSELFVDFAARLEARAEHGLPGDREFLDHVHPRLRTQVLLAETIGEALRAAGVPEPAAAWQSERWSPPDAELILAADPGLVAQEHLVRALACALARRAECVRSEAAAVLAIDPDNAEARSVEAVLQRVEAETRAAEAD